MLFVKYYVYSEIESNPFKLEPKNLLTDKEMLYPLKKDLFSFKLYEILFLVSESYTCID